MVWFLWCNLFSFFKLHLFFFFVLIPFLFSLLSLLRLKQWDKNFLQPLSASTTPSVSCMRWVSACPPRTQTIWGVILHVFVLLTVVSSVVVKRQITWNWTENNANHGFNHYCYLDLHGGGRMRWIPSTLKRLWSHLCCYFYLSATYSYRGMLFHWALTLAF